MYEASINPNSNGSVAIIKTDLSGQKLIQKKQRVKILQNILAMNSKHNLSFNRLLWLEARFHGKLHLLLSPFSLLVRIRYQISYRH